jgi:hypothetical protein
MMAPREQPISLVDVAASMFQPPVAQEMATGGQAGEQDLLLANLYVGEEAGYG